MRFLVFLPSVVLLTGCLSLAAIDPALQEGGLALVPNNPFGTTALTPWRLTKVSASSSNTEHSVRVAEIGQKILTANPEIGMRPLFATAGTSTVEVFHQGPHLVQITEGLVKKCKTDGELAAILAHELAEMVAEREILAHPSMRRSEEHLPPEVKIGNAGRLSDGDPARMVEIARFEQKRQQERKPLPLPDPKLLARKYLDKAGFQKTDLEQAEPLLQEAEENYSLEKQFRQVPPSSLQWSPLPGQGKEGATPTAAAEQKNTASPPATAPADQMTLPAAEQKTPAAAATKQAVPSLPVPNWSGSPLPAAASK
jgi:hypothetical protein